MKSLNKVKVVIPSNPLEWITLPPAVAEAAELFLSNPNQWLSDVRLWDEGIISIKHVINCLRAKGAIIEIKKTLTTSATGSSSKIRHYRYRGWV